jgi:O-antigen/teichoic acid export membrane protein
MVLRSLAVSGVKWASVSQIGRQAVQLATAVLLARVLAPSDFGLMSMAMVVIGFLTVFRDLGAPAAIIQRQAIDDRILSSLFWVNMVFGVLTMAAVWFLAPAMAAFYNDVRLIPLLRVMSFSFLVSGVGISQQALLERNLEFDKLAKAEIMGTLVGAVLGISLALSGRGVWSLVFQSMGTVLTSSILLWFFFGTWKPRWVFSWTDVRSVARFSLHLSGFSIFNYFARSADAVLIGKYLGAQELGYYNLAYRLMLYPLQMITGAVSRVMFPVYARMRGDDGRFRSAYLRVVSTIAVVAFPLILGILAVNDLLIQNLFGERWERVALLLVVLSPIGLLQSVDATTGSIYQAKGRTDWMFRWGVCSGLLAVAAFALGLSWGVVGVAVGYLVVTLLWTYPGLAIPFRLIHLPVRSLLHVLWKPLVCGVLMALVVRSAGIALAGLLPGGVVLSLQIGLGIACYIGASLLLNRSAIDQAVASARNRS